MLFTEVDPSSYFLDSSVFYSYHHVFCNCQQIIWFMKVNQKIGIIHINNPLMCWGTRHLQVSEGVKLFLRGGGFLLIEPWAWGITFSETVFLFRTFFIFERGSKKFVHVWLGFLILFLHTYSKWFRLPIHL